MELKAGTLSSSGISQHETCTPSKASKGYTLNIAEIINFNSKNQMTDTASPTSTGNKLSALLRKVSACVLPDD
jgi:hypothetical protein